MADTFSLYADGGGKIQLDPFVVGEDRIGGGTLGDVLGGTRAPGLTTPSNLLGTQPIGGGGGAPVGTITPGAGVIGGTQTPVRVGGTLDERLRTPEGREAEVNDRIAQAGGITKISPEQLQNIVDTVYDLAGRVESGEYDPAARSPRQGGMPLIVPLPIDPAVAALLTAAGLMLGRGGGGAPSGSTTGGSGGGTGTGAGSGPSTGGSTSGGSGGTQTTTPPTTPESGDGRLILIGGQPGGPFVGPVAPPVTPTTPPARPPEGTTPTPGVGIVPVPVTPPSVTPPPPVAPPSVTPPPVTPPPVTPPPVTPPPSPPRSPEGTTPTPPVAVVPVPVTTPTTTPSSGGNISFSINPSVATPITVRNPDLNREILREGRISAPALREIAGSTLGSYGMLAGQPGQYDVAAFQNLLGSIGGYNPQLTQIATEQTIQGQRALREANIADVQRLSQAAVEAQRAANPELYSTLGTYLPAAQGMLASDLARLQGGGRLTAEEVRSAQQAAREAGLARGREMDQSTIAAEVLNRDALMRAREAQSRANVQQSMQNVYGGIGAAQAATFNPFATLLGQQYGMQTANVGMNQALFGQGAGFTSGQFSNPFVQGLVNPYSAYAQDVYSSNFNAANARAIAEANANAAAQGANQQLIGNLAGQVFNYAIPEFASIFTRRTPGT